MRIIHLNGLGAHLGTVPSLLVAVAADPNSVPLRRCRVVHKNDIVRGPMPMTSPEEVVGVGVGADNGTLLLIAGGETL